MTQTSCKALLLLAGSLLLTTISVSLKAQETATIVKFVLGNRVIGSYDIWDDDYTNEFTYKNSKGRLVTIRTVDTLFAYAKEAFAQKLGVQISKRETVADAKQNMLGRITGFPNDKIKDVAGTVKFDKLIEVSVIAYPEPVSTKQEKKTTIRTYYIDMTAEVKVYDRDGNETARYKENARMDEMKSTEEIRGSREIKDLNGNEYFTLFAKALDSALANKK